MLVSGGSGNGCVLLRGVRSDQGGRFFVGGCREATAKVLCFWAVQDEYQARAVCCSVVAIWLQTKVVCVFGSCRVLTEFVCLSVASYIDGRCGSGGGCSCGVWLDFVQLCQESSEDDDGFGSPREGC